MFASKKPNYNKLRTNLRLCINRLKLLEKKKTEIALKARREIADYLRDAKDDRARIRVEHIVREDYMVEAMEIVEMFCDLLLARFGLLEKMAQMDPGLDEIIATILWVTPRLSPDIPEMKDVAKQLTVKFGKEYADCCYANKLETVNAKVVHKMGLAAPPKMLIENYLMEIAKSYDVPFTPDQVSLQDDSIPDINQLLELEFPDDKKGPHGGSGGNMGGGGGSGGGGGGGGGQTAPSQPGTSAGTASFYPTVPSYPAEPPPPHQPVPSPHMMPPGYVPANCKENIPPNAMFPPEYTSMDPQIGYYPPGHHASHPHNPSYSAPPEYTPTAPPESIHHHPGTSPIGFMPNIPPDASAQPRLPPQPPGGYSALSEKMSRSNEVLPPAGDEPVVPPRPTRNVGVPVLPAAPPNAGQAPPKPPRLQDPPPYNGDVSSGVNGHDAEEDSPFIPPRPSAGVSASASAAPSRPSPAPRTGRPTPAPRTRPPKPANHPLNITYDLPEGPFTGARNLDLPSVPTDSTSVGEESVDFDDLTRRFEELKKKNLK